MKKSPLAKQVELLPVLDTGNRTTPKHNRDHGLDFKMVSGLLGMSALMSSLGGSVSIQVLMDCWSVGVLKDGDIDPAIL